MGTAPRSPAQDTNSCSRRDSRWVKKQASTDSGRATNVSSSPASTAIADVLQRDAARGDQQPEHHEQPDLREPRDPLAERPGRGAVRQLAVAEHQGGRVDGGETGGVQRRGAGVREDRQGQHGERVEAGGRQRDPAHHPGAAEADQQARTTPPIASS